MLAKGKWHAHIRMQHAAVLDVGTFPNSDRGRVTTHHTAEPHTAVGGHLHIANDLGVVSNPSRVSNLRDEHIELVNSHESLLRDFGFLQL
jgi:hypothetical protein